MIDPRERELFDRLVALPATGRGSFLTDACEGDPGLHDRMVKLLEGHERESMQTVEAPPVSEPERIGPYYLLERIGEGGMGTVYAADQRSPIHRRVALKIIKPGMDTREVIARFEAERQALALMSHPNIAAILDAGATEAGRPYFVMEYVAGEPITEYCDRQLLGLRERLDLFLHVCDAVQHAHQKGIIHRDLKPSNILVTIEADRAVPKVIDFGIAKAIMPMPGPVAAHETQAGVVIGTPTYMSPEQADHTMLDIDTRSDVYALGMVLHELLVGDLPFDEAHLHHLGFEEIRRRIREQEFVRPSVRVEPGRPAAEYRAARRRLDGAGHRRRLRGDLDAIIMKALEKDRTRRYGSAVELADDVQRHLAGQAVRAGPDRVSYRMKKFVARHRTSVATAGVIVALLIGGIVASLWQAGEARRQRDLARVAQASAEDAMGFLVDMFSAGDFPFDDSVTIRRLVAAGQVRASDTLLGTTGRARRFHALGMIYQRLGMWQEADSVFERAVGLRREAYPQGHPELARSMRHLGEVRRRRGLTQDARRMYDEALTMFQAWYGDQHEEVARTYVELSRVNQYVPDWAATERYQRLAIAAWPPAPSDQPGNVPYTAEAISLGVVRLAALKDYMGDYPTADSIFRFALDAYQQIAGPDHPETVRIELLYGDFLLKTQGDGITAESVFRTALAKLTAAWGDDHRSLSWPRNSLADALAAQGRYEEAVTLRRTTLDRTRRDAGLEGSIGAIYGLAYTLGLAGQYQESDSLYQMGTERQERTYGPGFSLATQHFGHARVLIAAGRLAEAKSVLTRAMLYFEQHASIVTRLADVYHYMGRIAMLTGDLDGAEAYYLTATTIIDRRLQEGTLYPTHVAVQRVYRGMADLYEVWGRDDTAERYRRMVLNSSSASTPAATP